MSAASPDTVLYVLATLIAIRLYTFLRVLMSFRDFAILPAHIGVLYSIIDCMTDAYRRRTLSFGPPMLGSTRPRLRAALSTLGASSVKWASKFSRPSSTSPRYYIL